MAEQSSQNHCRGWRRARAENDDTEKHLEWSLFHSNIKSGLIFFKMPEAIFAVLPSNPGCRDFLQQRDVFYQHMTDLCCRLLGTNYHGLCFTSAKLQKHFTTSNFSHHIASHVENTRNGGRSAYRQRSNHSEENRRDHLTVSKNDRITFYLHYVTKIILVVGSGCQNFLNEQPLTIQRNQRAREQQRESERV